MVSPNARHIGLIPPPHYMLHKRVGLCIYEEKEYFLFFLNAVTQRVSAVGRL